MVILEGEIWFCSLSATVALPGTQYSSLGLRTLLFFGLAASNALSCFGLPWFAVSRIVNLGIEKSLIEILVEERLGMNVCWVQWLDLKTFPKLIFSMETIMKLTSSSWTLFASSLRFSSRRELACSELSVSSSFFGSQIALSLPGNDRSYSSSTKPNSFSISPWFTCNLDMTSSV